MKLLRDTWLVFERYFGIFIHNPVWVALGVLQPLLYLVLFAPLLKPIAAMRGFPPPPSLLADQAVRLADGQIFHIVTYGQKNMPSYAAQVPLDDRWRVIAYVRSLQGGSQP